MPIRSLSKKSGQEELKTGLNQKRKFFIHEGLDILDQLRYLSCINSLFWRVLGRYKAVTNKCCMSNRDRIKIMVVDRDLELFRQTQRVFQNSAADVFIEKTLEHALERFEEQTFDILLLSGAAFKFQIGSTMELLEIIATQCAITQVLILIHPKELPMAFSALKAGSYPYSKLPVSDGELRLLLDTALARRPRHSMNLLLKENPEKPGFQDMVGRAPVMQEVYRQIRQAAQTESPVLITGETGTGKELAARAIHQLGHRKDKVFVATHLGALPQELVSGELFGYEKGAFTGAWQSYKGSFERARGGTIFLDDIKIPELGYRDDVEASEGGWVVCGFIRNTVIMSQQ